MIYIDSYHEPSHIKKIFYYYYKFLKPGGVIFLDDISWLPYIKNSPHESEFSEIINRDTFQKILEIYNVNKLNLDLEVNFDATGTAKFTKLTKKNLKEPLQIYNSSFGIKNIQTNIALKSFINDQFLIDDLQIMINEIKLNEKPLRKH